MKNIELFSEDLPSSERCVLRTSIYKIIPFLILVTLASLPGIQALLAVPTIISDQPKPPSPDIDPFWYEHYYRVYELERTAYELQLTYFWAIMISWIIIVIVFVWVVIRLSASVSITEGGVFLSKKLGLIKFQKSWQIITSIYIEVTKGRRSDRNLKLIVTTHDSNHQIKLSFLKLDNIITFVHKLGTCAKHSSSLIFKSDKSTIPPYLGVKKLLWVWEAETEVIR